MVVLVNFLNDADTALVIPLVISVLDRVSVRFPNSDSETELPYSFIADL